MVKKLNNFKNTFSYKVKDPARALPLALAKSINILVYLKVAISLLFLALFLH